MVQGLEEDNNAAVLSAENETDCGVIDRLNYYLESCRAAVEELAPGADAIKASFVDLFKAFLTAEFDIQKVYRVKITSLLEETGFDEITFDRNVYIERAISKVEEILMGSFVDRDELESACRSLVASFDDGGLTSEKYINIVATLLGRADMTHLLF